MEFNNYFKNFIKENKKELSWPDEDNNPCEEHNDNSDCEHHSDCDDDCKDWDDCCKRCHKKICCCRGATGATEPVI